MKIDIEKLIEQLEMMSDTSTVFFDTVTGDFLWLDDFLTYEENEQALKCIENEPEKYLRLPTQHDIKGYSIMRDFVNSLPESAIRDELENAIIGKGALGRFKSCIRKHSIEQKWYAFRDMAIRDIAAEWCRENGINVLNRDIN